MCHYYLPSDQLSKDQLEKLASTLEVEAKSLDKWLKYDYCESSITSEVIDDIAMKMKLFLGEKVFINLMVLINLMDASPFSQYIKMEIFKERCRGPIFIEAMRIIKNGSINYEVS